MESPDRLAITVVVIFAIFHGLIASVAVRHGRLIPALVGWGCLVIFSSLKVVGAAVELASVSTRITVVINHVALGPLMSGLLSVLHEASLYYHRGADPDRDQRSRSKNIVYGSIHSCILLATTLVATGAVQLSAPPDTNNPARKGAWRLAMAGSSLLLVVWLAMCLLCLLTPILADCCQCLRKTRTRSQSTARHVILLVLLALPFLGARVLMLLVSFARQDEVVGSSGASVGVRSWPVLIQEFVVASLMVWGGVFSRDMCRDRAAEMVQEAEEDQKKIDEIFGHGPKIVTWDETIKESGDTPTRADSHVPAELPFSTSDCDTKTLS